MQEPHPNLMHHQHDVKQVPYWGPSILEWRVNLSVIWRFLSGACELIHISVCKEKNCSNDAENVRNHCTKFGCLHVHTPGTCVPRTVSALFHQITVRVHCHCFCSDWGCFCSDYGFDRRSFNNLTDYQKYLYRASTLYLMIAELLRCCDWLVLKHCWLWWVLHSSGTQYHIPEEWRPQLQHCESRKLPPPSIFKSCNVFWHHYITYTGQCLSVYHYFISVKTECEVTVNCL